VAGCCECGDESSGSCATELVISLFVVFTKAVSISDYIVSTIYVMFFIVFQDHKL
jgi:hypothetical protein